MNNSFSSSEVLSQAWNLMKSNKKFIGSAALISGVILGIIQFATMSTENMKLLSLIITVATLIITLIISVGWVNVVLRLIRGNSKKWEDFKVSP